MIARATMAEVDPVRTSVGDAVVVFQDSVLPALREQDGFEGAYVLLSSEGKVLALTFWTDEEAADAGVESGFYLDQVRKFVTVFKAPPGRETYEVVVAETATPAAG
jgi:heme-degrading monooxygenase HmoA